MKHAIVSVAYPVSAEPAPDQDTLPGEQDFDDAIWTDPIYDEFDRQQLAAEEDLHRNRGRFTRPAIRMSAARRSTRSRH